MTSAVKHLIITLHCQLANESAFHEFMKAMLSIWTWKGDTNDYLTPFKRYLNVRDRLSINSTPLDFSWTTLYFCKVTKTLGQVTKSFLTAYLEWRLPSLQLLFSLQSLVLCNSVTYGSSHLLRSIFPPILVRREGIRSCYHPFSLSPKDTRNFIPRTLYQSLLSWYPLFSISHIPL